MSSTEGRCVGSRRPTLPPLSNRTLHHPSLLPPARCSSHAVHPVIPAGFFYTDPTMSRGRRIPNRVSQACDCFRLNTPPPVMSACPAPPARADPFRSGPHLKRDLGSLTLTINTLHPPVQPSRVILQLTQEEDQAVTNLLKLHHQELIHNDTLSAPQIDSSSVDLDRILFLSRPEPFCSDVQHPGEASQGRCWSDAELEAANTLVSRFSLTERDTICGQNHDKSAVTLPDPLPDQHQGSETLPVLQAPDCTQNRERGEAGCRDLGFVEGRSVDDVHLPVPEEYFGSSSPSGLPSPSTDSEAESRLSVYRGCSEVKERTLADSEGEAVHALLNLGDVAALDVVQGLS